MIHVGDARSSNDWFAGDVDCDGNELVTVTSNELQKLRGDREKFMWQVRDTCTRAENAEAALRALIGKVDMMDMDSIDIAHFHQTLEYARRISVWPRRPS